MHTHEHTLRRKKYFYLHPLFCGVPWFLKSQMNLGEWPQAPLLAGLARGVFSSLRMEHHADGS